MIGIDLLGFVLLFAAGEIAIRWYREHGLLPALASLVDRQYVPADLESRSTLIPDAELGFRLNPAAPGVNSLGVRHPEIQQPKPSTAFRLLVVGDSVSWYRDGYVQLLRDALSERGQQQVEVINAAVPGYTTYQEWLLLRRILEPVAPDVVVVQYCMNDNHRFLLQLAPEGGWLMTQEGRSALLPESDGVVARLCRWSYFIFEVRKRLLLLGERKDGRHPWDRDPHFKTAWQDSSWEDERTSLLAMWNLARSARAEFLLLAVPWEPQLDPDVLSAEREAALKPQRMLARICAESDVPFLDLTPAFEARTGTKLYTDGIHLTRDGNEIVARELLSRLEREGMLP